MNLKKELLARLLEHPELEWKKSRFSKAESFFLGKREIAHFHAGNEIDIRLTRKEIRKQGWTKTEDKRIHLRSASTDWMEVRFSCEEDLDFAQKIVSAAVKANATRPD